MYQGVLLVWATPFNNAEKDEEIWGKKDHCLFYFFFLFFLFYFKLINLTYVSVNSKCDHPPQAFDPCSAPHSGNLSYQQFSNFN